MPGRLEPAAVSLSCIVLYCAFRNNFAIRLTVRLFVQHGVRVKVGGGSEVSILGNGTERFWLPAVTGSDGTIGVEIDGVGVGG